jgi:hypothetical protein
MKRAFVKTGNKSFDDLTCQKFEVAEALDFELIEH